MSSSKSPKTSRWSVRLASPALMLFGAGVAWAGGSLSVLVLGWVLLLNILAWVPAYLKQTERFYDLIGSASFISSALVVGWMVRPGLAGWIMLACVVLWSSRMAWFLVGRVHRQGKDGRFDAIKPDPFRFLNAWVMQGLWAFLCLLPVLVRLDTAPDAAGSALLWTGLGLWMAGFAIEVIADEQKRRFRRQYPDGSRFIDTGLWRMSRHPNYVGEILLWAGITVMAAPVVSGWQWIILITPTFVYWLLRFVSGVPLLEKRSDEKWGGQEAYEAYKRRTPVLFPVPWGTG
jgi:steroid 5-alpha reductase family enzyme